MQQRKVLALGGDGNAGGGGGGGNNGNGGTTSGAIGESKRNRKNAKKKKSTNESRKDKVKKRSHRRRNGKRSSSKSNNKSVENEKKPTPLPPPSPTPPTAAATSPPALPCDTQDCDAPSRRPVAKPNKRDREKVSLKPFLTKPTAKDLEPNEVTIGAKIETEKMEYKVLRKLGSGGCGETWVVRNLKTKRDLCAKVELLNKPDKRLEAEFKIYRIIDKMKRKCKSSLPHLLQCYDYGEVNKKMQFMFLPLCESSLEGYMKAGSPSLATAFELSMQVLEGIQEFHSLGFIHRDLKPANIVVNAELTRAYIIDFGMSCKFITDIAKMPESSVYDFIGTTKYAPREAHKGLPQSRKSDIEAWIYVILELFVPDILPWRDCVKNKDVLQMKELFFTSCYARRIAQAPKCYSEILPIIESTNVVAAPNYEKMFGLIRKETENRKIQLKQKFKFDSTLIELEIELWKSGEPSQELDRTRNSNEEIKMDSEKSPNIEMLISKTPSRTHSLADTPQRDNNEDQVVLHSTMKCRLVAPPEEQENGEDGGGAGGGGVAGSDDDSDQQVKGNAKPNNNNRL